MPMKRFRSNVMTPEQVSKIDHFNLREARRQKGPIYDVLIMELYEEGYERCAYHFRCLVAQEEKLHADNFINKRVRQNQVLLMALFENGKMAERGLRSTQCDGTLNCMMVLLQTLVMLQSYKVNYHWLVKSINEIIVNIAKKYGEPDLSCGECVAKIYYIYAEYNFSDHDKSTESLDYYRKCLQLCRGQCWKTNDLAPSYELRILHHVVAEKLASRLIKIAKMIEMNNAPKALEMADQAIITIAETTGPNINYLLCNALLVKTRLLLLFNRHKEAMTCVLMAEKKLRSGIFEKFVALICELYLYKGQCLQHNHNYSRAFVKFKQSLLISRKYKLRYLEAMALLNIGKVCMQLPDCQNNAHEALCESRDIFDSLKNLYYKKCSIYLLAQIEHKRHFTNFMQLLKGADKNFCNLYMLRKWKDQCHPFWTQRKHQTVYKLTTGLSTMTINQDTVLTSTGDDTLSLVPSTAPSKHILRISPEEGLVSKDCLLIEDQLYQELT